MRSTRKMIFAGMFTAVLAVMSQIQIPMPSGVPLTLQTYAIALTGFMLGWKSGLATVGVYLLLGLAGVPVFTGMTGGLGKLAGPTGGFLPGFLLLAAACGMTVQRKKSMLTFLVPGIGLLLCHCLGILHFQNLTERTIWESALLISVPYLPKDFISVAAAHMTAKLMRKRIGIQGIL